MGLQEEEDCSNTNWGMEEQYCKNSPTAQTFLTKTLAHLFIPKYLITTPVQYT